MKIEQKVKIIYDLCSETTNRLNIEEERSTHKKNPVMVFLIEKLKKSNLNIISTLTDLTSKMIDKSKPIDEQPEDFINSLYDLMISLTNQPTNDN